MSHCVTQNVQIRVINARNLDQFLENGRASFKLPDRIRDGFRQIIDRLGLQIEKYYFAKRTEIESLPEKGQKKTRIYYEMAPYLNGGADASSQLYTMFKEESIEEIPVETAQVGFCSYLQQWVDQIVQLIRNFFARLCLSIGS